METNSKVHILSNVGIDHHGREGSTAGACE